LIDLRREKKNRGNQRGARPLLITTGSNFSGEKKKKEEGGEVFPSVSTKGKDHKGRGGWGEKKEPINGGKRGKSAYPT